MSTLDAHMKKICAEMDISKLESNPEGDYTLPFDEQTNVSIAILDQGLYFSSAVAPCPAKNEEGFFTHALQGNLFGEGTLDATLGLGENGATLVLSRLQDPNLSFEDFKDSMEDFLNAIEFWQKEARDFE